MKTLPLTLLTLLSSIILGCSSEQSGKDFGEHQGQASSTGLCLKLDSPPSAFRSDQSIEVTAMLFNCGSDPIILIPTFVPEQIEDPNPWNLITFHIIGEDGRQRPYTGLWLGRLKLPSPEEFEVLERNGFERRSFNLEKEEFKYDLSRPARYQISATVTSSAREYLQKRFPEQKRWKLDQVFSGSVTSNTITVEAQ